VTLINRTRRDVMHAMAATSLVALPMVRMLTSAAAHAAGALAYDPNARFDLAVTEVELRRNSAGRTLMARIYQPKGTGPFPTVLDLHGGAWNRKDRLAEEPMDRALGTSGLLVVAVDMTVAPEAPYPACVQDANYAVRWLKANAGNWNGDTSKIGVYGSSTGGHVAELLAMRPRDLRYAAIPFADAANIDASVAYVAMRSPVSNPVARYENALRRGREQMVKSHKTFFVPWESIHESNPQEILERKEKIDFVPFLIMQGKLDDNVLPSMQEHFVKTYKAAGGDCEYHLFENSVHEWVAEPGPQTDKAREVVKAFIARQLRA
jgi:acetyl esterase